MVPSGGKGQRRRNRQALSCRPCRQHKLKCDRRVPCQACCRYRREDMCSQNLPSTSSRSDAPRQLAPRRDAAQSLEASHPDEGNPQVHVPAVEANKPGMKTHRVGTNQLRQVENTALDRAHVVPVRQSPEPNGHRITVSLLPQIGSTTSASSNFSEKYIHSEHYWREQLLAMLPSRNQCDMLVSYFLENINRIYHAIHVPTFRKEYGRLWDTDTLSVDLSWLSLLFIIISESALFLSSEVAQAIGLSFLSVRKLSHTWYTASRQALHASGFESQPQLVHLQTFLVSQLYWFVTNNVETLNSCLGQAVRNAQSLGLNKEKDGRNPLQTELRRRIWWELITCDTFQSCCLERPPLIHSSTVPLPANCNDDDVSETSIKRRPLDEPTEISYNILRAKLMAVLQKLYADNCNRLTSYNFVQSIDAEMMQLVDSFPWYYHIRENEMGRNILAMGINDLSWAQHQLHSCICVQRIRMYRPFLHPPVGTAPEICAKAAEDVLAVYSRLRHLFGQQLPQSPKFVAHSYQIYYVAVVLAAILLVERTFPSQRIRQDIEMVIADLAQRDTVEAPILAGGGGKLLQKMLDMCDRRDRLDARESERLVPAIATVFGGEQTARSYLRHDISYVLNANTSVETCLEGPVRVERAKQQNQQKNHLSDTGYCHNSTAIYRHQEGRSSPPSHREPYPHHFHFPTAPEQLAHAGPATGDHLSNDQQEHTYLYSHWSEEMPILSEFFENPQWDILAQQLLFTP